MDRNDCDPFFVAREQHKWHKPWCKGSLNSLWQNAKPQKKSTVRGWFDSSCLGWQTVKPVLKYKLLHSLNPYATWNLGRLTVDLFFLNGKVFLNGKFWQEQRGKTITNSICSRFKSAFICPSLSLVLANGFFGVSAIQRAWLWFDFSLAGGSSFFRPKRFKSFGNAFSCPVKKSATSPEDLKNCSSTISASFKLRHTLTILLNRLITHEHKVGC